MDDTVEVTGLSAILLRPPQGPPPIKWSAGDPEPEALRLTLRYQHCEYEVVKARTMEGARAVLDAQTENEWHILANHMAANPGWWVRLIGTSEECPSLFSFTYPTVEAAIVGALTSPPLMTERRVERQRRERTRQ